MRCLVRPPYVVRRECLAWRTSDENGDTTTPEIFPQSARRKRADVLEKERHAIVDFVRVAASRIVVDPQTDIDPRIKQPTRQPPRTTEQIDRSNFHVVVTVRSTPSDSKFGPW